MKKLIYVFALLLNVNCFSEIIEMKPIYIDKECIAYPYILDILVLCSEDRFEEANKLLRKKEYEMNINFEMSFEQAIAFSFLSAYIYENLEMHSEAKEELHWVILAQNKYYSEQTSL